jgi:hypothetical protein
MYKPQFDHKTGRGNAVRAVRVVLRSGDDAPAAEGRAAA